jgi:hypothetical protein
MIGVPIALIIFGMVDLGKAVIASKEDEVKKATKLLGKRFLYAIGVFAVVWFVTFVFDTLSASTSGAIDYKKDSKNSWQQCWKCNIRKTLTKDGSDPSDPDDPYVNLDDEKLKAGLGLLEDLSKEHQIIYFTCNQLRAK